MPTDSLTPGRPSRETLGQRIATRCVMVIMDVLAPFLGPVALAGTSGVAFLLVCACGAVAIGWLLFHWSHHAFWIAAGAALILLACLYVAFYVVHPRADDRRQKRHASELGQARGRRARENSKH